MSDMAFDFREGADEAEKASASGVQFPKLHYFSLKDTESAVLRFLHDFKTERVNPEDARSEPRYPHLAHPSQPLSTAWLVVQQHSYVPTKGAPPDFKGTNWPKTMGAVCRKDKAFGNAFPDCFICDFMQRGDGSKYNASGRDWALACIREEVLGDGTEDFGGPAMKGKILGYRDKVREVAVLDKEGKPTDEVIKEKAIVVVNMAYKNFYSALEGVGKVFGTILDRDFHITRKGDDQNTDYNVVDLGQQAASDGRVLDLRNPEHYERYKNDIDLPKLIAERASNDFYARFFDKRVESPPLKGGTSSNNGGGAPTEQQGKPEADVSDDKMREIANRVTSYADSGTPQGDQPAQEQQPATQETPAAQQPAPAAAGGGLRDFN